MAANILKRENATLVKTRNEYSCLYCGKKIPKGIVAKVYYISGLGREYFCKCHKKDDIVFAVWDLIDAV